MAMKISRTMRRNLKATARQSQEEFVRSVADYRSPYEPLVRRGLLETEMREYQPPPYKAPHFRLTALGRAVLNQNEPTDE